MDAETRKKIEGNLFPQARPAVEPWDSFPWHTNGRGEYDSWVPHSSQALAIDVFGTLKCIGERSAVLDALASQWGLPLGGEWNLELEADLGDALGEPSPTQVDAVAWNDATLLFFECKFTESSGGACSQPHARREGKHKGMVQCNGNYEMQVNPVSGSESRCALSSKGIAYWQHIPRVFRLDSERDHRPCPFAGSWYQWMPNIIGCSVESQRRGLEPAFVLVYADAPGMPKLPIAAEVASSGFDALKAALRPNGVMFQTAPYQEILGLAVSVAESSADILREVTAWVEAKTRCALPKAEGEQPIE